MRELDGRLRLHFTPTHASWLNQAEIGLGAIHRRYIRGVPFDSREALIERTRVAIADYNEHYAAPIKWSYSVNAMKDWYDDTNSSPTSAAEHWFGGARVRRRRPCCCTNSPGANWQGRAASCCTPGSRPTPRHA